MSKLYRVVGTQTGEVTFYVRANRQEDAAAEASRLSADIEKVWDVTSFTFSEVPNPTDGAVVFDVTAEHPAPEPEEGETSPYEAAGAEADITQNPDDSEAAVEDDEPDFEGDTEGAPTAAEREGQPTSNPDNDPGPQTWPNVPVSDEDNTEPQA